MAINYKHEFTVKGSNTFPVDMLRYDQAFPYNEVDSYEMLRYERSEREVKLVHYGNKDWEPGKIRWASFNWQVTSHRVSKLK